VGGHHRAVFSHPSTVSVLCSVLASPTPCVTDNCDTLKTSTGTVSEGFLPSQPPHPSITRHMAGIVHLFARIHLMPSVLQRANSLLCVVWMRCVTVTPADDNGLVLVSCLQTLSQPGLYAGSHFCQCIFIFGTRVSNHTWVCQHCTANCEITVFITIEQQIFGMRCH